MSRVPTRRRRPRVVKTYTPKDFLTAFDSVLTLTRVEPSDTGELPGYCPLCEDPDTSHTPSASFNPSTGQWNCLKTEDHGGSIAALAKALHVTIQPASPEPTVETPPSREPLSDQTKPLDWADALASSTSAQGIRLRALLDGRGIGHEIRQRAYVGMSGKWITYPVRASRESPWMQVKSIEYGDRGGKWVTQSPGSVAMLYMAEWLDEYPTLPVVLCEGETDTLLAQQESAGQYVAVGVTGGAGVVPTDLHRLAGREVFVAFDADTAGRNGSAKMVAALHKAGARAHDLDPARLGLLPTDVHGYDLSDYFRQFGGTAEKLSAEMERVRAADLARERFRPVSAAALAEPVPPMDWLVRGVFPLDSYGVLAGEKKTLKTYTDLALALAVASGEPFLGEFTVPEPRSVLMYLGEGGERPTRRRLQRLAAWMGVDLAALPLRMVFDAGDITGDEFLRAFERAVTAETPGLVIVDPLYAYHPSGVEAQNLYDRGAMLAGIVQMVPDGAAFLLADHFRKTGGKDLDLDSVAQAGVAQWADSWILQAHDAPPRVDEGAFSLAVQFGSRQWGGAEYRIDWSLGRFDPDAGEHDGDLSVTVRRAAWGEKAGTVTEDAVRSHIIATLEAEPLVHTQRAALELVMARARTGRPKVLAAWQALVTEGRIVGELARATEGAREVERERWRVVMTAGQKLHVSTPEEASDAE